MQKRNPDDEVQGGPLQTRADSERILRYVRWGLMGVGGLFVLKVALAVLLKPFVLVGGAVAAGLGWWALKKSKSGPSTEVDAGSASAASAAAPAVAVPRRSERSLALAEAERELDAQLAAEVERRTEAAVPSDELDEMERRLRQLEALKAKMSSDR